MAYPDGFESVCILYRWDSDAGALKELCRFEEWKSHVEIAGISLR